MPFGMGPAGWAYVSSYGYPYASYYPYSYPYTGVSYPIWPWYGDWGRGRGRGRGRGFGWPWCTPYWYAWW
jgi:hypothetical protein